MKKNSTLPNSNNNQKKEELVPLGNHGIADEMTNKLSFYLEYIEKNGVQVSNRTVQNILDFSRSFRVLKTKTNKHVELNLN